MQCVRTELALELTTTRGRLASSRPIPGWASDVRGPALDLHQDILADFVPIAHREQWDSRAKWVDIYRCKYGLIARERLRGPPELAREGKGGASNIVLPT